MTTEKNDINTEFGFTSWDDPDFKPKEQTKKTFTKVDNSKKFLTLKESQQGNVIRILTDPVKYGRHSFKEPGDTSKYGQKLKCADPVNQVNCPLCELNKDPTKVQMVTRVFTNDNGEEVKKSSLQPFFGKTTACAYAGVISRETNDYRIFDIPPSILEKIRAFRMEKKWGAPIAYDLKIHKHKNVAPAKFYSVFPDGGKEPLSDEDLKIKEQVDLKELTRLATPPTREKVMEQLAKIRSTYDPNLVKAFEESQAQKANNVFSTKNEKMKETTDSDFEFQEAD